jgi:radical SAM superfamily enzyme YgiQ (UPF0313 family)
MARVLLVSFSGYPFTISNLFPDNSLAGLAGELLRAGHEPRVLDFNRASIIGRVIPADLAARIAAVLPAVARDEVTAALREELESIDAAMSENLAEVVRQLEAELLAEVSRFDPDLVGFKLWMGSGFRPSVRMAEAVRRSGSDALIVAGGPLTRLNAPTVARATRAFDVLVTSEGEEIIADLAEAARDRSRLSSIPNLMFPDGSRTPERFVADLAALAPASYDEEVYPGLQDGEKIRIFSVDESRGCPNACHFCCHTSLSGARRRRRPVEGFVDELQRLAERHGARGFRYAGSSTPLPQLAAIAEEMVRRGLRYPYSAFARPEQGGEAIFRTLRESGCFGLFFGMETMDPGLRQRVLGKRGEPEEVVETIGGALDQGLFAATSVIFPLPGESEESERRTREALIALHRGPRGSVLVNFPGLFPRSRWLAAPGRYGFELPDRESYLDRTLEYEIKTIYPLSMWQPLPYAVGGEPMIAMIRKTARFCRELQAAGLTTQLQDEVALVGHLAGEEPAAFKRAAERALICGDEDWVRQTIRKVHHEHVH